MIEYDKPLRCGSCADVIAEGQAHITLRESVARYVCRSCYIDIYYKDRPKPKSVDSEERTWPNE